jgi:LmbE family N-acetylglucosaminyl deacetylase
MSITLSQPGASVFIPDNLTQADALRRVTHLGIGAHQDDLEFMALHGILGCFQSEREWFGGVTCTNGAGSSRNGPYAKFSDAEMRAERRKEQDLAAMIGRYACMIQLDHPSSIAKDPRDARLKNDLRAILEATRPRVVYTHNPADKHDTHIAVVIPLLEAVREMTPEHRPEQVFGCEGWRNLDWLQDNEKVIHDISARQNLSAALGGVFDSQIAGGKRYDLATFGRWRANATFFQSHASDAGELLSYAMDLTPLVKDDMLDIVEYVTGFIDRFRADVAGKLRQRLGH